MTTKSKLKEYRNFRSLTQEELSKSSGISIRTIQRIEKGLSTGSPHTIKTLAKVLDVENIDLLSDESNLKTLTESGRDKIKLMNISVLTMLVIPLGNIIFPSIIFFANRDDEIVNSIGRKILSFQILTMLLLPFFVVIIPLFFIGSWNGGVRIPLLIYYLIYGLTNIIITIRTSIEINKEKEILSFVPSIL